MVCVGGGRRRALGPGTPSPSVAFDPLLWALKPCQSVSQKQAHLS